MPKSKVYLVETSSFLGKFFKSSEQAEEEIEKIKKYLTSEDAGFEPVIASNGEHVFNDNYLGFAGKPELRAKQLATALRDEDAKAIIVINGGSGSKEVVYHLKKMHKEKPFLQRNIPFFCLSDPTTIAAYLESIGAITHVQGGAPWDWSDGTCLKSVKDIIKNPQGQVTYSGLEAFGEKSKSILEEKTITGELVGGCNFNVVFTCNTDFEPDWTGKILYLEGFRWPEGNGPGWVDDALEALQKNSKVLEKVSAICLGHIFHPETPQDVKDRINTKLNEIAKQYNIPIITGIPSGHLIPCRPVLLGTNAQISYKDGKAELTMFGREENLSKNYTPIITETTKDLEIQTGKLKSEEIQAVDLAKYLQAGSQLDDKCTLSISGEFIPVSFAISDILIRDQQEKIETLKINDTSTDNNLKEWLDDNIKYYFPKAVVLYKKVKDPDFIEIRNINTVSTNLENPSFEENEHGKGPSI